MLEVLSRGMKLKLAFIISAGIVYFIQNDEYAMKSYVKKE